MANRKNSRFRKGSAAYRCRVCNKLTRETGAGESHVELCLACWDQAGLENEHLNGDHRETPNSECELCRKEKKD